MQRDELMRRYEEGPARLASALRERPIASSVAAVRAARESSASLLGCLSDADWLRTGIHTESGPYSATTWLEIYAAHCHDHADQIDRAVQESRRAGAW